VLSVLDERGRVDDGQAAKDGTTTRAARRKRATARKLKEQHREHRGPTRWSSCAGRITTAQVTWRRRAIGRTSWCTCHERSGDRDDLPSSPPSPPTTPAPTSRRRDGGISGGWARWRRGRPSPARTSPRARRPGRRRPRWSRSCAPPPPRTPPRRGARRRGSRRADDLTRHRGDLDLGGVATTSSQWRRSTSSLCATSSGPPKRLQASAYCATRRSVFRSPLPPIMIRGCGVLTGSGRHSVASSE